MLYRQRLSSARRPKSLNLKDPGIGIRRALSIVLLFDWYSVCSLRQTQKTNRDGICCRNIFGNLSRELWLH